MSQFSFRVLIPFILLLLMIIEFETLFQVFFFFWIVLTAKSSLFKDSKSEFFPFTVPFFRHWPTVSHKLHKHSFWQVSYWTWLKVDSLVIINRKCIIMYWNTKDCVHWYDVIGARQIKKKNSWRCRKPWLWTLVLRNSLTVPQTWSKIVV